MCIQATSDPTAAGTPETRTKPPLFTLASAGEPQQYEPEPSVRRKGVALCLSGGGFRAALFHVGALRRLDELGIVAKIDMVSSVSGGSIVAAFWAECISKGSTNWNADIAAQFRRITQRNLRTKPLLARLLPWNWLRSDTAVRALADEYGKTITRSSLRELPTRPDFTLCATDLAFGVNWTFARDRCGDYQAGYLTTPDNWSVALATAASSCFPPVFNPLSLHLDAKQLNGGNARDASNFESLVAGLRLSDGGVYDNMGLEPVWKKAEVVLVSDGGSPFGFEPDRWLLQRILRYLAVTNNQARAIRKRWLIASFQSRVLSGTYWGVGGHVEDYTAQGGPPARGYTREFVDSFIAPIRTDLNPFSDVENAVLQNHGYLLADAAINRHAANLIGTPCSLQVPYPECMNEASAAGQLG